MDSECFRGITRTAVVIALGLTLSQGLAWGWPSEVRAISISVEFSVGVAGSAGLAGSGVAAENAAEFPPGPPGAAEADVYRTIFPPFPPASTNVKIYDDGGPVLGTLPLPPTDLTLRTDSVGLPDTLDVAALAIVNTSGLGPGIPLIIPTPASIEGTFVQFSVDGTPAIGIPGPIPPDVASEVLIGGAAEATGDVFEAFGTFGPGSGITPGGGPGAGNTLISDEGAHGLALGDDLDGLIFNDPSSALPPVIDTNGDAVPDMPVLFFTLDPASGLPATVGSGADVCTPATGSGPLGPTVAIPAASLGLAPGDQVDALWMDPMGNVVFSLSRVSPSLAAPSPVVNPFSGGTGCDPADLIHVTLSFIPPAPPTPPLSPPTVCALSGDLGLVGDGIPAAPDLASDNLDALWITADPHHLAPLLPVELSVFSAD